MKNVTLAVAFTLIAGATVANAADLGSYKDDGGAGYEAGVNTWTGPRIGVGAGISATGLEFSDLNAGIRDYFFQGELQYDYQIPGSLLVAGARGTINYTGTIEEVGFGADAILGVAVGNAKPYLLAGYEWRNWPGSLDAALDGGFSYGAGVDVLLTRHVVGGVEWNRVDWGGLGVADVKEDRFLIRAGYKF